MTLPIEDQLAIHKLVADYNHLVDAGAGEAWADLFVDGGTLDTGMGIVVEYAGHSGKPQWIAPEPFLWDYTRFGRAGTPATPDETLEITVVKQNGAEHGFTNPDADSHGMQFVKYNAAADRRSWALMQEFFDETLGK